MSVTVERVELDELVQVKSPGTDNLVKRDLSLIKHVEVDLIAEIGTAKMRVDEFFSLKAGDIVKLLQDVDEPISLILSGKCVAKGNLVAVDDNFGIEVVEIL